MIEAMACGTPVVAFRCGSVPEILEDGLTGYVVEDVAGGGGGGHCWTGFIVPASAPASKSASAPAPWRATI